ncbi:uncharacterized protein LOC116805116 [Drosophila grimshawi]|uniref:uncharacterized protein LOC116805116 n=1 Tax=Drosophila grimshawi TaxID=7222 RepID=UPI0013EEED8F|nr:uncharacterized protein LOC116805116 [Drosophila grimshawi]
MRPSLVSFIYNGILGADNNLPAKCPFSRNTTYVIRRMQFSSKYVPSILTEGNFTFNATFWGTNGSLFDMKLAGSICNMNHDCTGSGNVTTS